MFFTFPCTMCGLRIIAESSAEQKTVFTAKCSNCKTFHYFYFDKITRKTKKKQTRLFTELD
jgi:phage FluMu protein Com